MSMFTRRHYVWLARALRAANNRIPCAIDREIVREVVTTLAYELENESPQGFDKEMFLKNIFTNDATR